MDTWLIDYASILDTDYKLEKQESDKKELIENLFDSYDVLLEDYLARGSAVVLKNIKVDNLSQPMIAKLLKLEENGKKRTQIIEILDKKLK